MSERIGFVGLGIMGNPMSMNLLKAGFRVTVWNRIASRMDALVAAGARAARSAAEAAAGAGRRGSCSKRDCGGHTSGTSLPTHVSSQQAPAGPRLNRRVIVCVPVYNEAATVERVLDSIASVEQVDRIVIVDDGSMDGSGTVLANWTSRHRSIATLLKHENNKGYSAALLTCFRWVLAANREGRFSPDDIVVTIDADDQHDPQELPRLLRAMDDESLDVLWGRRDFSLYPLYKRLGNGLMSALGTWFAGQKFHDIETGYCLFKIDALDAALAVHKRDWRYSLTMTLAVSMARLGFKLSNEHTVSIKVFRSRTRYMDVAIDSIALAHAWYQVERAKLAHDPAARAKLLAGAIIFGAVGVLWLLMAIKSIYLGADSVNNYAHVWFISKSIYSESLPLHIPYLNEGRALTFPYGFLPWMFAAILRPVFGDYAVTWTFLLGVAALGFIVYRTQLRQPWLLALFLAFPFLLEATLSFQMAFIWSMVFAYLYVAALDQGKYVQAWVWLVVAASTHLLIGGLILALYSGWVFLRRPEVRGRLAVLSLSAAALLTPLALYMTTTPAVGEQALGYLVLDIASTVLPRLALFCWPMLLAALARRGHGRLLGPSFAAVSVCLAVLYVLPEGGFADWHGGFYGLTHKATNGYQDFVQSRTFQPGGVYRVMEATNREQGQYYLIQKGAVLSHEFFGESMRRQVWTHEDYARYLRTKGVDYVILNRSYHLGFSRSYDSETATLRYLEAAHEASVIYQDPHGRFIVFDVRPLHAAIAASNVPALE